MRRRTADADRTAHLAREALDAMTDYFGSAPFFPATPCYQEILKPIDPDHLIRLQHGASGKLHGLLRRAQDAIPSGAGEDILERARYNFAHHIAHAWIPKRC